MVFDSGCKLPLSDIVVYFAAKFRVGLVKIDKMVSQTQVMYKRKVHGVREAHLMELKLYMHLHTGAMYLYTEFQSVWERRHPSPRVMHYFSKARRFGAVEMCFMMFEEGCKDTLLREEIEPRVSANACEMNCVGECTYANSYKRGW